MKIFLSLSTDFDTIGKTNKRNKFIKKIIKKIFYNCL